jgi:hypothetical protein
LILKGKATWNFETTIKNLKLIQEKLKENGDREDAEKLRLIIERLEAR